MNKLLEVIKRENDYEAVLEVTFKHGHDLSGAGFL